MFDCPFFEHLLKYEFYLLQLITCFMAKGACILRFVKMKGSDSTWPKHMAELPNVFHVEAA